MSKNVNMKSLFEPVKAQPKVDKSFDFIEKRLATNGPQGTNDISVISKWFKCKYENKYGKPMLGYNFFNCRNTIKLLSEKYECSNWQVCQYINSWFQLFHSLGYDRVASDDTLTLSVLKTDWIVSGLMDKRRPNESKRNTSYKTHGQSRRMKTENSISPNKSQISDIGF